MPQFTHGDRNMVMTEAILWASVSLLTGHIDNAGVWSDRIYALAKSLEHVAQEIRDYNDQFEEE